MSLDRASNDDVLQNIEDESMIIKTVAGKVGTIPSPHRSGPHSHVDSQVIVIRVEEGAEDWLMLRTAIRHDSPVPLGQ